MQESTQIAYTVAKQTLRAYCSLYSENPNSSNDLSLSDLFSSDKSEHLQPQEASRDIYNRINFFQQNKIHLHCPAGGMYIALITLITLITFIYIYIYIYNLETSHIIMNHT